MIIYWETNPYLPTVNTVNNSFYTWKSPEYGTYGYGIYVIYSQNDADNYEPTPFGVGDVENNFIESGQAFILQTSGGSGSISFNETVKADAYSYNNTVFRGSKTSGTTQQLRTNLYSVNANGSTTIADGTLIQFSANFSNKVDVNDARKIFNPGPSLSIKTDNIDLIVESRQIPSTEDTIHFSLTNAAIQNYRFVFVAKGLSESGLQGFLEDHYQNTLTPLNMEDTTVINFKIENVNGSNAANRFDIVFKPGVVLPVTITSVNAGPKDHDIKVDWKVINEKNVRQYEVERSVDGVQFMKVAMVPAVNSGTGNYSWLDTRVLPGYYYYRIKSIDNKGKVQYTANVKVLMGNGKPLITVYPNPITNGIINLQFINQPAGKYGIRLMNPLGQIIISKQIQRMDGSNTENIQWNYNLAHGVYQLEVTYPNGDVKIIKLMY